MQGQKKVMTLNDAIDLAVESYRSGNEVQAAEIYKKVLSSDPKNPLVYLLLGDFMERIEKLGEAAELYTHALGLNPSSVEAQEKLARVKDHMPVVAEVENTEVVEKTGNTEES